MTYCHIQSLMLYTAVLQYADDTLIIIKAKPNVVANLRKILYDLASTTILNISFLKITCVHIHLPAYQLKNTENT